MKARDLWRKPCFSLQSRTLVYNHNHIYIHHHPRFRQVVVTTNPNYNNNLNFINSQISSLTRFKLLNLTKGHVRIWYGPCDPHHFVYNQELIGTIHLECLLVYHVSMILKRLLKLWLPSLLVGVTRKSYLPHHYKWELKFNICE